MQYALFLIVLYRLPGAALLIQLYAVQDERVQEQHSLGDLQQAVNQAVLAAVLLPLGEVIHLEGDISKRGSDSLSTSAGAPWVHALAVLHI